MAREHVCPRCHAGPGVACRKNRNKVKGTSVYLPGSPMKGVHPERMALLPFELDWHRVTAGLYRAVDTRTKPHTVYETGKDEGNQARLGYPWYLACWPENREHEAQRKTGLGDLATARRLAMSSRCDDCCRFVMFGDLEHKGHGFWRCRDRVSCQAVTAEKDRIEREQFEAIEREPWAAIEMRQGRVVGEMVFSHKHGKHTNSTVVKMTPEDIKRAIEVLTDWRDASPPLFDVDTTPAAPGPDWEWPDGAD